MAMKEDHKVTGWAIRRSGCKVLDVDSDGQVMLWRTLKDTMKCCDPGDKPVKIVQVTSEV